MTDPRGGHRPCRAIALTAVPRPLLAAAMTPAFLTVGALARPAPPPRRTPG
ncbi:hypothetical protein [Streptomyces sp. bgisy034]|uniref:hypothetical protein n=1 Tax=Streptomyces sp. bgisy034 TaxID=3413774 RepID=UPI003EBC17F5